MPSPKPNQDTRQRSERIASAALNAARHSLAPRRVPAEYIYAPDNHAPDDPVELYKWAHETHYAPRSAYVARWDDQALQPVRIDRRELQGIRDQVEAASAGWAKRCRWETTLADRIAEIGSRHGRRDLADLAASMHDCHQGGPIVRTGVGEAHIAWRSKCERVRVCPHASREDTMRLAEHYVPGIRELVAAGPRRRVYFAVFQPPNYAPGSLAFGKKNCMERVRAWVKKQRNVIAALVVQEDPLGRDGSWNVHANVLLVTEGDFDYDESRELAGCRVHFSQVKNVGGLGLVKALLEIVKYSAKPCATNERDARDPDRAPFMTEWPPDRFIEWWDAQQGFRRTRAYGALYAIDGKRWNAADDAQRAHWLSEAWTHDREIAPDLAALTWAELSRRQREAIKAAMLNGERVDLSCGSGIGTVEFDHAAAAFLVTLQPGDKSTENRPIGTHNCAPVGPCRSTGPPPSKGEPR